MLTAGRTVAMSAFTDDSTTYNNKTRCDSTFSNKDKMPGAWRRDGADATATDRSADFAEAVKGVAPSVGSIVSHGGTLAEGASFRAKNGDIIKVSQRVIKTKMIATYERWSLRRWCTSRPEG